MIIIRTKNKISLAQALTFAEQQKNRNVKIREFFEDDCKWQLEVSQTSYLENSFKANVQWYQLVPYETGEGTGEMKQLIYREDFTLESADIQALWEAIEDSISYTDNYLEKVQEFTAQGILIYIGTVRNIFGIGIDGFEIV